jgi:hypothetical protein
MRKASEEAIWLIKAKGTRPRDFVINAPLRLSPKALERKKRCRYPKACDECMHHKAGPFHLSHRVKCTGLTII